MYLNSIIAFFCSSWWYVLIAEEHPLKQGLKHIIIMLTYRIWLEESNIICQ
jgi:hypothetical protein